MKFWRLNFRGSLQNNAALFPQSTRATEGWLRNPCGANNRFCTALTSAATRLGRFPQLIRYLSSHVQAQKPSSTVRQRRACVAGAAARRHRSPLRSIPSAHLHTDPPAHAAATAASLVPPAAVCAPMVASTKAERLKPPVFHEVEVLRGWRILQQHLAISVSLANATISGTATFQITALNHHFVNVSLNLRRCRVRACKISGQPAPFRLVSPLDDRELLDVVSSNRSHQRVADVEHSMALREDAASMHAELVIDLPANISADVIEELKEAFQKSSKNDSKPDAKPDEEYDELPPDAIPAVPLDALPRLSLTVEYEVLDHTASGVHYGHPSSSKPLFDPTYMLTDGRYGMARSWMPCVDSMLWCDRYLFDFDITVKSDLTVIASGELQETRLIQPSQSSMNDDNDELKLFKYRSHAPSHASEIVLVVGPFIPLPDPSLPNTVTHFCLPGRVHELVHTGPPLFAKALAFCRDYFGADPPCSSFKQIFVGSLGMRADSTIAGAGGLVVHSGDFLHTARCIDEGLAAREAIMIGLVTSYFGRFLRPRSAEDDWLITGLAAHVAALGLQAILGRNWYRFRILDLMDELRFEASCDLSDIKINRVTDATVDSVRRRSHIIVYMIERRIGNDVMKRALRDIVAEGRSVTIATVAILETALSKANLFTQSLLEPKETWQSCNASSRVLRDLNGGSHLQNSGGGVVSSGFDEALQGVSVGPFLKRLRAICGTDLRSLVRLWAASPGIPRLQIGYQYNPRRHTIEFVMKQEAVEKGARFNGRQGLPFTGTINVRVMEIEGASDHSVEVRDHIFVTELPCHSRRAKHKSAAQAEKEFNENPARASPVLWVRVDPEQEWCKDVHFNQSEDSWMALLKGERDALGQFEACRGLAESSSEMGGKALLSILEDNQIYWRVRAECAKVLAQCTGGLPLLLQYFRSCYTDNKESNSGIVRLNNFSNFADYFVKRAMIKALINAHVPGSRSASNPQGSIPLEATEFLSHILGGNDNAGNDFDDDHYVVDLLQTAAELGVRCVDDKNHMGKKDGGISTTDSIVKQLERYRSIEQLIPGRSGLTVSATVNALSSIEVAKLRSQDMRERGAISRKIMMGEFTPNSVLVRLVHDLSHWRYSLDTRVSVMMSFAEIYGGDLDVTLWLLTRVDSTSLGQDIQDCYLKALAQHEGRQETEHWFTESATLRYKLLDALSSSASSKKWYSQTSPLLLALRRHTKRAIDVCIRVLRLSVSDSDPRVRASAMRFAKIVWGIGVPVCLLSQSAYADAKRHAIRLRDRAPTEIVQLKTNGNVTAPQLSVPVKAPKQGKLGKSSKLVKIPDSAPVEPVARTEKVSKKRFSIPRSQVNVGAPVLKPPKPLANGTKIVNEAPINVDEPQRPKKAREGGLQLRSVPPPVGKVKPAVIELDKETAPLKLQVPRSVQTSIPKSRPAPEVKFAWEPLDNEDLEFLKKAREIEKAQSAKTWKEGQREIRNGGTAEEVVVVPQDKSENAGREVDGEHKKKKKKKKKRHLEGEDGLKKKKKKKKKREDGQKYAEVEPDYDDGLGDFDNGSSSLAGGASANGERKIGKFRIKLSSVAPPAP